MRWYVISPKFDYMEWVCEFGGPTYEISCVAEVEGNTAREARLAAIKERDFEEWVSICRSDGTNPLIGLECVAICPVCSLEQMEGEKDWECPICGEWWRGKMDDWGGWEYFNQGQRYTKRERNARIRRYLVEHPDYPA